MQKWQTPDALPEHGPGGGDDFSHRPVRWRSTGLRTGMGRATFCETSSGPSAWQERAGLPRAYATDIALEPDSRLLDEACGVGEPGT